MTPDKTHLPQILREEKHELENEGYIKTLSNYQKAGLAQMWTLCLVYFASPDSTGHLQMDELRSWAKKNISITEYDRENIINHAMKNDLCKELLMQSALEDLDCLLLRFLRARKWDIIESFSMFIESIRWRIDFGVREIAIQGEKRIPLALRAKGKAFIWGEDKRDRVLLYMRAHLHDKNAADVITNYEHVVSTVEAGRRLRKWDEQPVSIVIDLANLHMACLDATLVRFVIKCLQAYYPEVLGNIYAIDAPWFFWGFWKLIQPLLDPVVASKVMFINRQDLKEYIDEEMLPVDFGGKCPFQYHYHEPRADPISDEELYSKESTAKELASMEREFLSRTINNLFDVERDEVKRKIRLLRYQIEVPRIQDHEYHRLGILDDRGVISWHRALEANVSAESFEALQAEGRGSAPPFAHD